MITRRSWPWNSSTDPTVMLSHFCFLNIVLIFSTFIAEKLKFNYHITWRDRTSKSWHYLQIVFTSTAPGILIRVHRCWQQEYIYFPSAFADISLKCGVNVRTFASPSFFCLGNEQKFELLMLIASYIAAIYISGTQNLVSIVIRILVRMILTSGSHSSTSYFICLCSTQWRPCV